MSEKKQIYIATKISKHEKQTGKIVKNINPEVCAKCGGMCCKSSGCSLMPCDVRKMSVKGIKEMLDTGNYSLRVIELIFDKKVEYIVGMSSRRVNNQRVENNWLDGRCVLLTENGCMLSDEDRPTGALLSIPSADPSKECKLIVSPFEYTGEWKKYATILNKVLYDETGHTPEEQYIESAMRTYMFLGDKLQKGAALDEFEVEMYTKAKMTIVRARNKYC